MRQMSADGDLWQVGDKLPDVTLFESSPGDKVKLTDVFAGACLLTSYHMLVSGRRRCSPCALRCAPIGLLRRLISLSLKSPVTDAAAACGI